MNVQDLLALLHQQANPANVVGMARFGITTRTALGVPIPFLRRLARSCRRQHQLALDLWATGVHEARLLATLVDDPKRVTAAQMEAWVKELDSWDLCDQLCNNLFRRAAPAWTKALAWSRRKPEFVRRAGFVLMATLAVHDKAASDADFEPCFAAMLEQATDQRNFVRKAINWALRQIGKRNPALRKRALQVADEIARLDSKAARWIAADAIRELRARAGQGRG